MRTAMIHQDVTAANTANTYEVQGFTAGEWRVLCVCSNASNAMNEVAEARSSGIYLGIRVTVECYDQIARKNFSRVVYHYSPLSQKRPPVSKPAPSLPGDGMRQARASRASVSADYLAHNYLDWIVATRLALAMGVAVVAVMAITFH